jgi:hypothetical protein
LLKLISLSSKKWLRQYGDFLDLGLKLSKPSKRTQKYLKPRYSRSLYYNNKAYEKVHQII